MKPVTDRVVDEDTTEAQCVINQDGEGAVVKQEEFNENKSEGTSLVIPLLM